MNFNQLDLHNWIKQTLLNGFHLNNMTTIQEQSILPGLKKQDLIIVSETGTGKTLSYLLPILNNINLNIRKIQSIIIAPTKELVRQIYNILLKFKSYNQQLNISILSNDSNITKLFNSHILVSTPSNVTNLINKQIDTNIISSIVLDEADLLIDYGFKNTIINIFNNIKNKNIQKIVCSATFHETLSNQIKTYLNKPLIISTSKNIWSNNLIQHSVIYSDQQEKTQTLLAFLKLINPFFCIIFANTQKDVEQIYHAMLEQNYNVGILHKNLLPRERKKTFKQIGEYKYKYLVATDLVSRGIDIQNVDCVISYDLPEDDIWYMHRIGRSTRNKSGKSYIIYNDKIDAKLLRLANKNIKWNFLQIKNNLLVKKDIKLKKQKHRLLDEETNSKIRKIIFSNSKKVKPSYKKKIRQQIHKIKQQKRHEFIEKQIKKQLLIKNIKATKNKI